MSLKATALIPSSHDWNQDSCQPDSRLLVMQIFTTTGLVRWHSGWGLCLKALVATPTRSLELKTTSLAVVKQLPTQGTPRVLSIWV